MPSIEFHNVSYTYPGGNTALENISLNIAQGELLAVIGPNGGGKSTLIKVLLGLLPDYQGRVSIFDKSPAQARREGIIGYVPQRSEAERSFPISVRQAVLMGASRSVPFWKRTPLVLRERADKALADVGAAELAEKPVGELSGGQWQRVLIARALTLQPKALALDEPLVGIDAAGQRQFAALLHRLRTQLGMTIILVSHDLRTVAGASAECDKVACLRRTLHFHAAPQGVTPQVLAEVFSHDLADIFGDVHVDAHRAAECGHEHHPARS